MCVIVVCGNYLCRRDCGFKHLLCMQKALAKVPGNSIYKHQVTGSVKGFILRRSRAAVYQINLGILTE